MDWFEHKENKVNHFCRLMEPYQCISTGPSPLDGMALSTAQYFDIFMNVSDSVQYSLDKEKPRGDTVFLWYPLRELECWGYEPFFWSKKVLDSAYEDDKKVYMHCHAGVNRSPNMALAWLLSRGHSLEEAALISKSGNEEYADYLKNKFLRNIEDGHIPDNLPEFYRRIDENPGWGLEGILTSEPPLIDPKGLIPKRRRFK